MEQEIKERFEMLEDMGLSIEFEKRFLETKKIPYGMGVRGRWLDDSVRERRVQGFANEFNEMFQAKAYYYGTVEHQEVQLFT